MNREQSQAETFATAVDDLFDQGTPPVVSNVDESLLSLANRLRHTASHTMIDPRFRASLRLWRHRRRAARERQRQQETGDRGGERPSHGEERSILDQGLNAPRMEAFVTEAG